MMAGGNPDNNRPSSAASVHTALSEKIPHALTDASCLAERMGGLIGMVKIVWEQLGLQAENASILPEPVRKSKLMVYEGNEIRP